MIHNNSTVTPGRFVTSLNVLYIVGLFTGSLLYIGVPYFSLLNIILVPSFIVNFTLLFKYQTPRQIAFPLFFFFIFWIYVGCVTILTLGEASESAKAFFYLLNIINLFMIPAITPNIFQSRCVKIAKFFILLWFGWAILQLGVIMQILPLSLTDVLWIRSGRDEELLGTQINGPFTNSNDFGVVTLLVLLYILFYSKFNLFKNIYFYLCTAIIIMAMSRTALVLLLILFPLIQWVRHRMGKTIKVISIVISIFVVLALTSNVWYFSTMQYLERNFGYSAITIDFKRAMSILYLVSDDSVKDGSAEYRTTTYNYAINKLPTHFVGTGFQNYKSFYIEGNFSNHLVWTNPHSFLIEIGIATGIPGLICFLIALFLMAIYSKNSKINESSRRFFYLVLLYSLVLSNVPSSIILMPIFWLPLFTVYSQNINSLRSHITKDKGNIEYKSLTFAK